MKQIINARIIDNVCVADDIYKITLNTNMSANPGQFILVSLPSGEFTLRRPFGIAKIENDYLTIFYRVVGRGTSYLTNIHSGSINILGALGNSFQLIEGKTLLVGGGLGLAPLLFAASQLKNVDAIVGCKNEIEANLWMNEFKPLVNNLHIATNDGSIGFHGFVTDLLPILPNKYDMILTCGPEIMMRNIANFAKGNNIPCQVSLEKRMACGLGACLSCSIDTVNGRKKVCKDGPVFFADDIF